MTDLVRAEQLDDDDLAALRSRVVELEATLAARSATLARLKGDLDAFRITYRLRVGLLHERLDEIELAIAEAELGELSTPKENGAGSRTRATGGPPPPSPPQYTSDAIRKLFRDVAKAVHPDLAGDDVTRDRRHALMVEANRAYAIGDEQQLRWILQAWQRSPEAVPGSAPEAIRLRLRRRIAQIDEHLEGLAGDLEGLKTSALWQLKHMVDEAAARGKDLIGEMVARLERDIMIATNRLEAIRPPQS